ncbi:MAG TPA: phage tail tip lysozyme [Gemmataceae bacterium]|nr:phage tail tip lysozyme [Gemmataceae bacterium]
MTILDTFYLLFKTDANGAKSDVAALDKQLDELEKKGRKRSDDENKRFKELEKQRKDLIDQLKEQQRETDKLDQSFQSMISSAVGAVTAYASFGALKTGLIDANRLNASLAILGRTTGQNAGEIKAYGAALEQTGGKAEDLYAFIQSQALYAAQHRTPLPPTGDYITRLHNAVKNLPPGQALTYLQQIPGAVALAPLLELSDDKFNAAIAGGHATAKLRDADEQAALANQEAYARTRQAFDTLATEIDTNLLKAINKVNDALTGLAQSLQGHPNIALGTGVLAAGAASVGSWWASAKIWQGIKSLFGAGAATEAAATGGLGTIALGGAAIAGTAYAGLSLEERAILALGDYFGLKRRASGKPTPTSFSGRQRIMDFWISQGYSPGAAAGWTANAQAESRFNPLALNGSHVGLYQWSSERRARILSATGIDVAGASLDDQLKAAAWEAKTYGLGAGSVPDNAAASAALISNRFEVPSLTQAGLAAEAANRARIAVSYGVPGSAGSVADGAKAISIKTGDIHIQTQATDAPGIARAFGDELKSQIRMAMSNFDDGVQY